MSLIFGNLTQQFVEFTIATNAAAGNASAQPALDQAAANFRTTSAKDASYLVCIGKIRLQTLTHCSLHSRRWYVRLHLPLHACLGLHW